VKSEMPRIAHNRNNPINFMRSVSKTETCWLWQKAKDGGGYGRVGYDGKNRKAHQVAWQINFGPIPKGLSVLHRCDVRHCVNPTHLFLGTQDDNMKDCARKGRIVNRPAHGEANPMARLSRSQVEEIRGLYPRLSQNAIAKHYGVSQMTINRIVNGKTWRHE